MQQDSVSHDRMVVADITNRFSPRQLCRVWRQRTTRGTLVLVVGILLLAGIVSRGFWSVPLAHAINGRDFAGFYELSNVTELVDEFQLTFVVQIFNYSDADVTNATVKLESSLVPDPPYATLAEVSLLDRDSVVVSHTLIVPAYEYEYWQAGGKPRLSIQFTNTAGETVQRGIELIEMLLREEE